MLTWLGRTLYRLRWSALLLILLVMAAMAWYGFGVFDALGGSTGLEDPNSESLRAQKLIDSTFTAQSNDTTVILLLSSPTLKATDLAFTQAATQMLTTLKAQPEVSSLRSYYTTPSPTFLSRDGHETFVVVTLSGQQKATEQYEALLPFFTAPPLHIDTGGYLVASKQFDDQLRHDLEFAEVIALPIVALLLVLIFSGVIAALMPLLVGGFSILGSFALLRLLTTVMSVSSFASNVVTIIGLGLAIDYSLFIVTRFREELILRNGDVSGSLQRTMATAGRTVLFSGLTVCTSLLSLLLFPQTVLHSIGLATIASALVAMLGAITFLPIILALLGSRVNALSLQRLFRRRAVDTTLQQQGMWYRLSYFVMRWRIPIALTAIAFLFLLGSPFLHASFASTDERSYPLGTSSRTVTEHLKQNFPNQNNTSLISVIQTSGDALSSENLAKLDTYVHKITALSGVTSVTSLVTLDPRLSLKDYQYLYTQPAQNQQMAMQKQQLEAAAKELTKGNVTQVNITANLDPHSQAAHDLVQRIRSIAAPSGFSPLLTGQTAAEMDQFTSLGKAIPNAILVMAAAIFILLFLMTGSLVMPLKAIILNILSLSATFGAIVWIFQDGHFQDLLGFKAFGALDSTQPILIFAIAFGLSMDYEVFLLSRIKEHFDKTGDNREAVAVGLQRTGWLITSAAMLLAVVVAAFATSRIIFIQEIGLGLALAVLMDATVVRAMLVPSMMALLGNWNWWAPRPLQSLWNHIGLREPEETSTPVENVPVEQNATPA